MGGRKGGRESKLMGKISNNLKNTKVDIWETLEGRKGSEKEEITL